MKLICGPMATISHPAFRILIEKFGGCDEYFTEMINAGSLLNMGPFEKYYIDPSPVPEKIVWQLTGVDADRMEKAAEILANLPGIGVDINMGCSAPDIYKTGAGIAWMTRPRAETEEMVRRVGKVVLKSGKRFSVKLRLGDEDFTDSGFFAFCDMLVDCGVQLLTLHPRTKKEKLTRPPRWHYCQDLCDRFKNQGVEIYLNGNVKDAQSLAAAKNAAPDIGGVMISRAAVQKPWIFRELRGCSDSGDCVGSGGCEAGSLCGGHFDLQSSESAQVSKISINMEEIALQYIEDIEKYQPQEFWKTRLQRFFTYFSQNFLFAHYAQTQFLNATDNDDLRQRIHEFFEKCPEERALRGGV